MPDKGTLDEILGVPAGGKENYSMDPALREQEDAASDAVGAGKENTGTDPALRTAQGTGPIETLPKPKSALPAAKAEVQNQPTLAQTTPQVNEGDKMQRILTALGYDAPETPEQKAKREKTEKWEKAISAIGDGISAMAGLHFAAQTGISNYSPEHSMSAKTKARWDKLNADRKTNQKAYTDAYLRVKGMQDQEGHWRDQMKMQQEQYAQQQANWEKQFEANQEQREKEWQRTLSKDKAAQDQWEKEFELREKQVQFQNEQARKTYNLQWSRNQQDKAKDSFKVFISDTETLSVPKASLDGNIDYLYNSLPEELRSQVQGEEETNSYGMPVLGSDGKPKRKQLTPSQKWAVVQQFISDPQAEATRTALYTLAGKKAPQTSKPKLF